MTERNEKIQRLLPRHFKIIDLALAGHDNKTIAQTLGLRAETVGLILRSSIVQHEMARARERSKDAEIATLDRDAALGKARSILEQSTERAALTQVKLLESTDPNVQLRASNSILDRVYGSGEESRKAAVINITNEQVQLLVLALQESTNARITPADGPTAQSPVNEQVSVCQVSGVPQANG